MSMRWTERMSVYSTGLLLTTDQILSSKTFLNDYFFLFNFLELYFLTELFKFFVEKLSEINKNLVTPVYNQYTVHYTLQISGW